MAAALGKYVMLRGANLDRGESTFALAVLDKMSFCWLVRRYFKPIKVQEDRKKSCC